MESLIENTSTSLRYYSEVSTPLSDIHSLYQPVNWPDTGDTKYFMMYDLDLVNQNNDIVDELKKTIFELQVKLNILRTLQEENLSHKLLGRYSFSFFVFFSASMLSRLILDVTIVQPLWNFVGLFFSFGFLLMSWAMGFDWDKKMKG